MEYIMAKQNQDMFEDSDPFLDEILKAKPTRQSQYFQPGHYLVQILNFKRAETRKRRPFIALETVVLDSDVEALPAGSEASWLQMTDLDTSAGNIKNFLTRALNISSESVTKEVVVRALAQNPETGRSFLAGLKLEIHAKNIITKDGNPFTTLSFIAVPADKQATAQRFSDLK
jgi:hypothetical protein